MLFQQNDKMTKNTAINYSSTILKNFRNKIWNYINQNIFYATRNDVIHKRIKKSKKINNKQNKWKYKESIGMKIEEELNDATHNIFQFNIINNNANNDIINSYHKLTKFKLSHYNADGLLQMLTNIHNDNMDDNIYIVCVGYKNKIGGDIQIGFSGAEKKSLNETPFDILQRECIEEIGNLNCTKSIRYVGDTIVSYNKTHTTIGVCLDNLCALTSKKMKKNKWKQCIHKSKQQRINGILYGDLKNVLRAINLCGGNRPLNSRDNIDKICAIPILTAIDMVTSLRKSFEGCPTWHLNKTTLLWKKN